MKKIAADRNYHTLRKRARAAQWAKAAPGAADEASSFPEQTNEEWHDALLTMANANAIEGEALERRVDALSKRVDALEKTKTSLKAT